MASSEVKFLGIAAKYLVSNICRLEESIGCFVCLQCDAQKYRGVWNPEAFKAHINQAHPDVELFSCAFCGLDWPSDKFTAHVASHFTEDNCGRAYTFCCPSTSHSTTCTFRTDDVAALKFHLRKAHLRESATLRCSHCLKTEDSLDAWITHISTHAYRLYHCLAYGCHVKSPSRRALIDHINRIHPQSSSGSFTESIEFICAHSGSIPTFLRPIISEEPQVHSSLSESVSQQNLSHNCADLTMAAAESEAVPSQVHKNPKPLCLRCPKCHLSTLDWKRFHNHLNACLGVPLPFELFWCPSCTAVSTERGLIEDHILTVHNKKASVIVENFCRTSSTVRDADSCQNPPISNADLLKAMQSLASQDPSSVPGSVASPSMFPPFAGLLAAPAAGVGSALAPFVQPTQESDPKAPGGPESNPLFAANPFLEPSLQAFANAMAAFIVSPQPPPPTRTAVEEDSGTVVAAGAEIGTDTEVHSNGYDETPNTPTSSTNTADELGRSTRTSEEELVSFPFDEAQFRADLAEKVTAEMLEQLVEKLRKFSSYIIRILGKENHRRVPQCPVCERVFSYGLPDFKRHLLVIHLGAPREYLKDLLRYVRLSKAEPPFADAQQQQLLMQKMRPLEVEPGVRKIPLPYSINILQRLTEGLPDETRQLIAIKMRNYNSMTAFFENRGGLKRYKCGQCNYTSPHALADVRKHILGSHCGISTRHFRFCLQASRLDHTDFCLLSDDKLDRLAKEFIARRQVESAESEAGSSVASVRRPSSRSPSPERSIASREPDENGFSRFTTVIPGSKNPVKVRIRGPIPPGEIATSPHGNSLNNSTASGNSANMDLSDLPKIPGLEGADRIVDLPLPYSETVLRQLMENAGATPQQIEDMCGKMQVYSSKSMVRICQGDRTLAFRCSCGRMFVTTRQPDSKMRAATLADSRRHVMGVHARIPHEYITICCQASRISRENGFQLYPDEMLHRLAMDRPIKLSTPESSSASLSHRSSSKSGNSKLGSLPPLRPLADLSGDNSEDENPIINNRFSLPAAFHPLNDSVASSNGNTSTGADSAPLEEPIQAEPIDTSAVLACLNEQDPSEVERVIDLPYSKSALQLLVRGYCPPNYFSVLLKKMQVYTAYKVFVTRRRGRRYFCCSGCSSVSPHGMGDIRKHILGVHAKVPERYKAAAMHCSRLSREDNSLLNDESLINLAKMKWKGNVIKPLAEISLASGSSLNSIAAVSPFTTDLMRSSRSRAGQDAETSPVVLVATPHGNTRLYSCSVCYVASVGEAAMRSHVAREHLGACAYECTQCPEAFNASSDLISHCATKHMDCAPPSIPPLILPAPYREAMSSVTVKTEEEPLSFAAGLKKEAVAMEDDELGTLWIACKDNDGSNNSTMNQADGIAVVFTHSPPPVETNGDLVSSSAVFPSPMPFPVVSKPLPTPNTSTTTNGTTGSSRRKPSKANLVQLKQPKNPLGVVVASPLEDERAVKRPRLKEEEEEQNVKGRIIGGVAVEAMDS